MPQFNQGLSPAQIQNELDRCMPAANKAGLGTLLVSIITAFNNLVTEYNALLSHLDTADVAGIGNANHTTFAAAAAPTLGSI